MKYIRRIFLIIFLSLLLSTNIAFSTENNIVSVSNQNVEINSDFYIILNLSNISYTKFRVEITNSLNLSASQINNAVSELSNSNTLTSFVVDKNSISLDKLAIVYTAPNQKGGIDFNVNIISLDSSLSDLKNSLSSIEKEINELQVKLNTLNESLKETTADSEEYAEISAQIEEVNKSIELKNSSKNELVEQINNFKEENMSEEITVNVQEAQNKNNQNEMNDTEKMPWEDDKEMFMKEFEKDDDMASNMRKMMEQMSDLESDLKTANNTISSLSQDTTYQGSQNNYLSNLSITGVELENGFKKTTSTYFAKVDENTTSVTVNASPEESTSIVTVYGNNNLESGKNKVLINVTAENGSVRTYKIYITK